MTPYEQEQRIRVITILYKTINQSIPDLATAAIVKVTEPIPLPWLKITALYIMRNGLDTRRPIGAPDVIRTAIERAGFRAVYLASGYQTPTLEAMRWWPPPGVRVSAALSSSRNFAPDKVQAHFGWSVLLPGGAPFDPSIERKPRSQQRAVTETAND